MTNRRFNRTYVADVQWDTYQFTEDGSPVIGTAYRIWIDNEYGERLEHSGTDFADLTRGSGYYPEWSYNSTGIERANNFVVKVQAHINAGGEINQEHWQEVDPVYGSPAYSALCDIGRDPLVEWEQATGNGYATR